MNALVLRPRLSRMGTLPSVGCAVHAGANLVMQSMTCASASLILLIATGGCGPGQAPVLDQPRQPSGTAPAPAVSRTAEAGTEDPTADQSAVTEPGLAALIPIPLPDLDGVDSVVRQQIRRCDDSLTSLRQRSDARPDELAAAYGELGMLYHTYQLFDAAEACYRNAHRLAPDSFRWAYCLGAVYDSRNEPSQAIAPLETAVKLQPNSVPALVNLAEIYLMTGKAESAESLLQRALQADPACAVALVGMGKIAAERQDFPAAIRRFEAALAAQPGATAIHYPLAMAYRRAGDLERAKVHLDQRGDVPAQIDDPLMAELRQLRTGARFYERHAVAAGKAGRLETAVSDLRRALEAEPESPSAHLNLGTALALSGQKAEAMQHYREALRLKPAFPRAHYNLAVLLAESAAHDEAIEHLQRAIEVDPRYFDAHLALADALARKGQYESAASHDARAVEIDPRHPVARLRHATALIRIGRYADARASLEDSRAVLPESLILAHALARLLAACPESSQRDGPRALQLAQAAFQTRQTAEHAETVAMAYAEMGNYEQAKVWQNRAIALATDAPPTDLLLRLRQNLTRYQQGQPARDTASSSSPSN